MFKSVRAASIFLLCFCLALMGCGGSTTTSSSNPTAPGNGNNPGGNGGTPPSNASETLYEAFRSLDNTSSGIRAFNIDLNNGTLSQLPGFPLNGAFVGLSAAPAGNLLFNSHGDNASPTTTAYQINPSSRALTQSSDNPGIGGSMVSSEQQVCLCA